MLADVLARHREEAAGAGAGVANDIFQRRLHHIYHHPDDVPRRAELPVLSRRGDLAEQVFVHIAFGVAVGHVYIGEHIHHLREQSRGRDHKGGTLHVFGKRGAAVAAVAQKIEHPGLAGKEPEHIFRVGILEAAPAQGVFLGLENGGFNGLFEQIGFLFFLGLQFVKPPDKEQIGHLLDHGKRVGQTAGPEGFPYAVYLGF